METTDRILDFFLALGRLEKSITQLRSLYMKEAGLKGADLPVLFALMSKPEGCRPDQLRKMTGTDKAQISRTLKALGEHGLVRKVGSGVYKSSFILNEKGKELADRLSKDAVSIFEHAHTVLDDEQWQWFYDFCDRLSSQMDLEIENIKGQRSQDKEENL